MGVGKCENCIRLLLFLNVGLDEANVIWKFILHQCLELILREKLRVAIGEPQCAEGFIVVDFVLLDGVNDVFLIFVENVPLDFVDVL